MKKKEILTSQKKIKINKNGKQEKESFLDMKKRELEEEKKLDQEEIIKFDYKDEINHRKIVIQDKRKIKVALMDFELQELIQEDNKQREECRYNPKTDDPIDEEQDLEKMINRNEVEELLEDVLQQTLVKTWQKSEDRKKILEFLQKNIFKLSKNQAIALFMGFYLDFEIPQIAKFLNVSYERTRQIYNRMKEKLQKYV
ncbi:MAG: hypothetical protein PHX62_01930 [Bacilli bacterium]|nr:hypothetical protein [Bacilli bacterium]